MPGSAYVFILPLIAGALAYTLRRWRSLELLIAAVACLMVMLVLAQPLDATLLGIDIDGRLDLLGRELQVHPQDKSSLLLLFNCALVLLLASWRTPENWTFVPVGMAMLSALSAALMVRPFEYAGLSFVVAGALGALLIQAERSGDHSTSGARRYLVISVLALPAFLGAGYLAQRAGTVSDPELISGAYAPAVTSLILGIGLVIGAIPLFTWIFSVANDAPPLTTAFLATVGVGAVSFLLLTFMREFDWFRSSETTRAALRLGGTVMLIMAAALGWAQKSLTRVMACAVLLEVGCALLASHSQTQQGAEAIGFAILSRTLSLGLFGIGAALLRERCGADSFDAIRGAGSREAWLALAIGVGGLSMAGMPGTVGFVSNWANMRALNSDVEMIVILIAANISVALGVLHAISALFDGVHQPTSVLAEQARGEQWTAAIGTVLVLALGLYPAIISPLAQAVGAGYY